MTTVRYELNAEQFGIVMMALKRLALVCCDRHKAEVEKLAEHLDETRRYGVSDDET